MLQPCLGRAVSGGPFGHPSPPRAALTLTAPPPRSTSQPQPSSRQATNRRRSPRVAFPKPIPAAPTTHSQTLEPPIRIFCRRSASSSCRVPVAPLSLSAPIPVPTSAATAAPPTSTGRSQLPRVTSRAPLVKSAASSSSQAPPIHQPQIAIVQAFSRHKPLRLKRRRRRPASSRGPLPPSAKEVPLHFARPPSAHTSGRQHRPRPPRPRHHPRQYRKIATSARTSTAPLLSGSVAGEKYLWPDVKHQNFTTV